MIVPVMLIACFVFLIGVAAYEARRANSPIGDRHRRRIARRLYAKVFRECYPYGWVGTTLCVAPSVGALVLLSFFTRGGSVGWSIVVSVLNMGAGIAPVVIAHRGMADVSAFLEQVRADDCRICLGCLYPLKHLGDQGRCPECGQAFSHAELVEGWYDVMRL